MSPYISLANVFLILIDCVLDNGILKIKENENLVLNQSKYENPE